jgi:hypothetical protein
MKNIEKVNLITQKISSIKNSNRYIKEAKKEKINFYSDRIKDLENMEIETIEKHNFLIEIINASLIIEKLNYFSRYKYKLIDKLEKHEYSPEQNKIYFRNMKSYIKIPNINTIEKAIIFIINNQSLEQIKSI